jgi:type II secretory pathway pseudopilin PulG
MKKLQPYLPALFIGLAAIIAVYFLYFKPKQEEQKAANAAAQSAADAANTTALTSYNTLPNGATLIPESMKSKINPDKFKNIKLALTNQSGNG